MQVAPTKIIVVTAYGDDRIQQAIEAGARDVLMKPVLEEQLAHAITEVTGRHLRPAPREDAEDS
jgi:CheY-like chemotaxis protein